MWIDEIDGLFAGHGGHSNDGGTSERVHKAILQDMQNDSEGIFYVFTANDIDKIPAPLIDRIMLWSVDLPNPTERLAIWRIHIGKLRSKQTVPWNPDDFDLNEIVAESDGFSGRQIERVWMESLKTAFNEGRPPNTGDVIAELEVTIPTSKSMAKEIEARRARLQGKATPASDDLADALARPAAPTRKISKK
jgi:SpoVK/Ycf46/Vps4 family AAA+-type ATPase